MTRVWLKLTTWLRTHRAGNMALVAAMLVPPVLMLVGMTVDFGIQTQAKMRMQNALDGALLAAARAGMPDGSARDTFVLNQVKAAAGGTIDDETVTVTVDDGDEPGVVVGQARGAAELYFGGVIGRRTAAVNVSGEVNAKAASLELVLVLDTTASMTGAKITALKAAATTMINSIMTDGGDVRVAVVPFAQYVNIGTANRNLAGLAIPPDTRTCRTETYTEQVNYRNCRNVPRTCRREVCRNEQTTCTNDGVTTPCTRRVCSNTGAQYDCSYQQCDFDTVTRTRQVCTNNTWRGCVGSRQAPRNTQDEFNAVGVPGLLNTNCDNPLLRLTNNRSAVLNRISTLTVNYETYIPAGLSMGWAVLTNRVPFADGVDPASEEGRNTERAIVLMTDGMNTLSKQPNNAQHTARVTANANAVTADLCTNVKADGIMVATVAFSVTDVGTRQMLTTCATEAGLAYEPTNAQELADAFRAIAGRLSQLRVSR